MDTPNSSSSTKNFDNCTWGESELLNQSGDFELICSRNNSDDILKTEFLGFNEDKNEISTIVSNLSTLNILTESDEISKVLKMNNSSGRSVNSKKINMTGRVLVSSFGGLNSPSSVNSKMSSGQIERVSCLFK